MEETEGKQGLKINDRRRFDSAGNEINKSEAEPKREEPISDSRQAKPAAEARPEARPADEPRPQPKAAQAASRPAREDLGPSPASIDGGEGISFHSFIMSLAHQALMLLGEIPGPDGKMFPPDKEAAKQTIDILSMLEHKTKGNLSGEEQHFLEEILHELRLRFVRG